MANKQDQVRQLEKRYHISPKIGNLINVGYFIEEKPDVIKSNQKQNIQHLKNR